MLDYQMIQKGKEFTLHCLFDDGEEVFLPVKTGPRLWYRAIEALKKETGRDIHPADFSPSVETLYHYNF
jgi:hypothetical protein